MRRVNNILLRMLRLKEPEYSSQQPENDKDDGENKRNMYQGAEAKQ
jgi:hypothetical protein